MNQKLVISKKQFLYIIVRNLYDQIKIPVLIRSRWWFPELEGDDRWVEFQHYNLWWNHLMMIRQTETVGAELKVIGLGRAEAGVGREVSGQVDLGRDITDPVAAIVCIKVAATEGDGCPAAVVTDGQARVESDNGAIYDQIGAVDGRNTTHTAEVIDQSTGANDRRRSISQNAAE